MLGRQCYPSSCLAAFKCAPTRWLLPFKHVDHVHPDAVIALAASTGGEEATREIWGDAIGWIPWKRPGFELGVMIRDYAAANPRSRGAILAGHGLIFWAEYDKECYLNTIGLIADAGITGGAADGTYRPRLDVRRDQMATFLARGLDSPR